jgi:hypothetical protein
MVAEETEVEFKSGGEQKCFNLGRIVFQKALKLRRLRRKDDQQEFLQLWRGTWQGTLEEEELSRVVIESGCIRKES